jgi:hypothetical protein
MRGENRKREMFGGVARRHGGRDAAVVALWLALAAGFVAEVTPGARPSGPASREPVIVASAAPSQGRRAPVRGEARPAQQEGAKAEECRCP